MSEKKFSNFTEDYEDIFATGSLPEQQPAASNDEDEDYETIGNICDTSVMTKMEKKGFFSQEQAKHMDTVANLQKSVDSQSQTNAVQNVLDESVKAEDVVHEDEVRYATAEDLQNEKLQKESEDNKQALEIEGKRIALDALKGATEELERTSPKDPHARQYKNSAVMPKVSFAKPSTQGGGLKKLFLFLIACCAVGIFFGVEANSYYNYKDGKTNGVMSCTFSWLTVENLPISVTPLDTATFFGAFAIGAGILGIIGLFIWLDSDAKKKSRVGHEHGSSHLGTSRDFKVYKNKFMEK